ncbi:MAG: NAD-dependent epimerase/dehydratase family protein [Fidelibacterota bacterium]
MRKLKILVTGGAGFIGSHVVDAYVNLGHKVVVIDNLSTGKLEFIHPEARFYAVDIRDEGIEEIFHHEKFDVVNHHAAQMDVRRSVEDPLFDAKVNVLGSLNILQNCVKNRIKKFIFASTGGAVYGEQDYFPADENHPLRPLSPYGVTKLTVEKYLHFYYKSYGLKYIILRYTNVYGPRQNPYGEAGVVAIFSKKLIQGDHAIINGDGKQTRDYVYVSDVVQANVNSLERDEFHIINIGTSIETDVNTIFNKINDITGRRGRETHGPPKKGEQRRSIVSINRATEVLNWYPAVGLDEGLKRTVEYFINQNN